MRHSNLKTIEKRIKRLEDVVFGRSRKSKSKQSRLDYSGATGGVRFLISKKHFKKKLGLGEIRAALAEHEYHYSRQAVYEALNRLAGKGGPLVVPKEGGKKLYVERK